MSIYILRSTWLTYLTWGHFFFSRYPSVALARNEIGHKKCGADIMRWWCGHQSSRNLCPIPASSCQRPSNRRRRRRRLVLGRRSRWWGHRRRRTLHDAGRGRVWESMSWSGCCSSACVQCLGLTAGACAACSQQPPHTARPRHGSCQTLITLTRRSLSVSRALRVLSSCVLCLAPPAVDLLEALDWCVCTRRACCFCLRISHFCCFCWARPRGWRAVAFSRWLHDRSGLMWLIAILIVRCCFGGLCAYETGLLLVCACRTSAASVEPLTRGSRAVTFARWLQVLSYSTWLILCCCTNSRSCKMRCFCDKKAAQVGKSALFPYYIWTILSTKFCTASLDHMRRGSKVVLRKKNNKKMTI